MYHRIIENSVIVLSDGHIISINKFNPKLEEWNVSLKGLTLLSVSFFTPFLLPVIPHAFVFPLDHFNRCARPRVGERGNLHTPGCLSSL